MPSLFSLAQLQRWELLARDAAAARDLIAAYGAIYTRIQARLAELTQAITVARAQGETVTPAWLFQRERLNLLLRQVAAETEGFTYHAAGVTTQAQAGAVALAQTHALTTLSPAATFARLPAGAINELVGLLADGTPLRGLLDRLAPTAVMRACASRSSPASRSATARARWPPRCAMT